MIMIRYRQILFLNESLSCYLTRRDNVLYIFFNVLVKLWVAPLIRNGRRCELRHAIIDKMKSLCIRTNLAKAWRGADKRGFRPGDRQLPAGMVSPTGFEPVTR